MVTLRLAQLAEKQRVGELTPQEERDLRGLDAYCSEMEVDTAQFSDLADSLAGVPYLHDVRLEVSGGPISGAQVGVVAEMYHVELARAMVQLGSLSDEQRKQRVESRAVFVFEGLEQALERPGLFQHVAVREEAPGYYRNEIDRYTLRGTVHFGRKEGTRYEIDLFVPVELRVRAN